MKTMRRIYSVPYILWLGLFVIAPVLMIIYQSFFDMNGQFTLNNYLSYFTSGTSLLYDDQFCMVCIFDHVFHADHQLPDCLFFNKTEAQAIMADADYLPTWVNLLLKAYAFIGIFSVHGSVNHSLILSGSGRNRYYSQTSVFCSWQRISRFHS